jgi:iron complex outermembrane receptor protein
MIKQSAAKRAIHTNEPSRTAARIHPPGHPARGLLASGTAIMAMLAVGPAFAAADGSTAAGAVLEEVTVTANKKISTVQQTPIALSAYSGDELNERGIANLSDLTAISSDFNISQNTGKTIVTIRGISSQNTDAVGDPAVAVGTDGVFLSRSFAQNANFYDIERVEVLRGPQGTLYGRNATGGLIDIITAKPSDVFGGYANAEFGNYNAMRIDGAINMPVSDTLQTRLAYSSSSHDGYRDNAPSPDGDDLDTDAARLTAAWSPFAGLRATVQVEYSHISDVGQAVLNIPFVYQSDGLTPVRDRPPLGDEERWPMYRPNDEEVTQKAIRATVGYDLPFATLTYVGGYDNTDWHKESTYYTTPAVQPSFVENQSPDTLNQELRLSARDDAALFWQVGAYLFKERNSIYSFDALTAPTGERYGSYGYDFLVKTESKAAFGQLQYNVTDAIRISAGMRYTKDDKDRTGATFAPVNTSVSPIAYNRFPLQGVQSSEFSRTTWHAGVDWQVTANNMLYAKADTGFKSGGFTPISDYGPETVTAFEIGSKNRFFNGALTANASAFHYDYDGYQVAQYRPNPDNSNSTIYVTVNADTAKIYGADLDLTARLSESNRIGFDAAYLHTALGNLIAAPASRNPNLQARNVQLRGNSFPGAPDWTLTGSYEHDWRIESSGVITFRLQGKYESTKYFTIFNFDDDRQGGYVRADASVAYAPSSGRFQLQAFVRNLTDEKILVTAGENSYAQTYAYAFAPPRTYGVRANINF